VPPGFGRQPDFGRLFDRPVIVLAAPRSGSTLLFETLAEAPEVWTVGGESHRFIEGLRPLNPAFGQVDSNRLDASHAGDQVVRALRRRFARFLRDRDGREYFGNQHIERLRFLEKTPKNGLRQPFLEQVFPGALYVFLVRDPCPNISSMMEAWKSGRWVTYPRLRGWQGPPWSLLLPPGWQQLNGRPLADAPGSGPAPTASSSTIWPGCRGIGGRLRVQRMTAQTESDREDLRLRQRR
jgi:hypothetical protein